MSAFREAKTNWTAQDYYTHYDLNRVEDMTLEVTDEVNEYLNIHIINTLVRNRNMYAIEYASSLNRIEGNIKRLGDYLAYITLETPKTDWKYDDPFDYRDANRLEQNLLLMYVYLTGNKNNQNRYCGQVIAGEKGVY